MKHYTVNITNDALSDMEEIYNHIAYVLLSPNNALAQYNRIAEEILTLDTLPMRFRIMDSEPEHSKGIRKMYVDNYTVFFVIRENSVIVTNVLYSASDIESRLRELSREKFASP